MVIAGQKISSKRHGLKSLDLSYSRVGLSFPDMAEYCYTATPKGFEGGSLRDFFAEASE